MKTILIANRGEIAVRIMRACREMGIGTVAVYSDVDREARHVRYADRAFPLHGNAPGETYLRIDKLIAIAKQSGADGVHPGYGFLAENEDFAQACVDAGLTFIGPTPAVIARMGSKTAARDAAIAAGAPVVPGTQTPVLADVPDADVQRLADAVGYPLMVKAVAGGGGKGMREVRSAEALVGAVHTARSEALGAFGDAAVYFERRVERPRHVEIQLLADQHGTVVPFVERECSIQRRHQKVIEESPAPRMSEDLRARMAEAAASVARTVGYTNAGTIEFLVDAEDRFYFLEMNTRLQVEHPVTEMVTGVDLVQWQIRIARGERLTLPPEQALVPRGHAIECRVYAEDPDQRFMPRPGRITSLRVPAGPGVRDDGGVDAGFEVPIYYDSMISKLVAWGGDREQARLRMLRALSEYHVGGIPTTLPFFRWMLRTRHDHARRRARPSRRRAVLARRGWPSRGGAPGRGGLRLPRQPDGSRERTGRVAPGVARRLGGRGQAGRAQKVELPGGHAPSHRARRAGPRGHHRARRQRRHARRAPRRPGADLRRP
jgi:acetyl-CoA carboxylase biotin carboxylase subunit